MHSGAMRKEAGMRHHARASYRQKSDSIIVQTAERRTTRERINNRLTILRLRERMEKEEPAAELTGFVLHDIRKFFKDHHLPLLERDWKVSEVIELLLCEEKGAIPSEYKAMVDKINEDGEFVVRFTW